MAGKNIRHQSTGRGEPRPAASRGGTVLGVFVGLVLGILCSLAVVWYMNRTPAPFRAPAEAPAKANGATPGGAPAALPGKPGETVGEKRFQFYDILPGKSDPKPEATDGDKATPTGQKPPEAKPGGPLSLQAGSFQAMKDAENLKATLALMGVEPSIQEVVVGGKQWFRVRIGPFASFEELHRVRGELGKSGIQAVVVKPGE